MSRIINPESAGKERLNLSRAILLALRELMKQTQPDATSRDLAAFISLALNEIYETINVSVTAWEKRDYWLKADRFRMEWAWSQALSEKMSHAVIGDDWGQVALLSVQIAQKLSNVKFPVRHRIGEPWIGAWKQLNDKKVIK